MLNSVLVNLSGDYHRQKHRLAFLSPRSCHTAIRAMIEIFETFKCSFILTVID